MFGVENVFKIISFCLFACFYLLICLCVNVAQRGTFLNTFFGLCIRWTDQANPEDNTASQVVHLRLNVEVMGSLLSTTHNCTVFCSPSSLPSLANTWSQNVVSLFFFILGKTIHEHTLEFFSPEAALFLVINLCLA